MAMYAVAITPLIQGRINVPRGPWHIIGAGPLDLTYPQPPNGILNPEFKDFKISLCISCVEKFPVYLQKKKELYINNLIELKFNPVHLYH
jgi:hypothetical protein